MIYSIQEKANGERTAVSERSGHFHELVVCQPLLVVVVEEIDLGAPTLFLQFGCDAVLSVSIVREKCAGGRTQCNARYKRAAPGPDVPPSEPRVLSPEPSARPPGALSLS